MKPLTIPNCPPDCYLSGIPALIEKFKNGADLSNYNLKASAFLGENTDKYWVLYRSDFPQPVDSGTSLDRIIQNASEPTSNRFKEMEAKHGFIHSQHIFIYYVRADTISKINHARFHLMVEREFAVANNLHNNTF